MSLVQFLNTCGFFMCFQKQLNSERAADWRDSVERLRFHCSSTELKWNPVHTITHLPTRSHTVSVCIGLATCCCFRLTPPPPGSSPFPLALILHTVSVPGELMSLPVSLLNLNSFCSGGFSENRVLMNLTFGKAAFLPLWNMAAPRFVNAAEFKKKKNLQGTQAQCVK